MWTDLGMQSRHISDKSLSAFPYQSNPEPKFGRLHSQGLISFVKLYIQGKLIYCMHMMHVQWHFHLHIPYTQAFNVNIKNLFHNIDL